jgi:hypothetical protein
MSTPSAPSVLNGVISTTPSPTGGSPSVTGSVIANSAPSQSQIDAPVVSGGVTLVSVSASLATGPLNDLAVAGYVGGTTNRLLLTAAVGGTTINGISASGVPDGFTMQIINPSTTDALTFAHLAAGSLAANRFSNVNAASVQIPPLGSARLTYVTNQWQFA